MFNLEPAITEWRQQMQAAGLQAPELLAELENHLREEIEHQTRTGLGKAEAFQEAVRQIGSAPAIQEEFKKVGIARADRDWQWMQILFMVLTGAFPAVIGNMVFSKNGHAVLTSGQQISCLAAAIVFSLFAWGGRLGSRWFPIIPAKRTRDIISIVGSVPLILWWIVLLRLIVPRYDFTMGQFLVTFLWAFLTPTGAWIGWHWGLETAARKEPTPAGS